MEGKGSLVPTGMEQLPLDHDSCINVPMFHGVTQVNDGELAFTQFGSQPGLAETSFLSEAIRYQKFLLSLNY